MAAAIEAIQLMTRSPKKDGPRCGMLLVMYRVSVCVHKSFHSHHDLLLSCIVGPDFEYQLTDPDGM